MSARLCRYGVIVVALALLFSSCALVKQRRRIAASQAARPAASSESSELRRENEALRKTNQEALERIDALVASMKSEQAEQRRFRDMMATNFDLLEQSVSLSLSKSLGRKPVVQPDQLKLPQQPAPVMETSAAPTAPVRSPRSTPPAAAPLAAESKFTSSLDKRPEMRAPDAGMARESTASGGGVAAPVAAMEQPLRGEAGMRTVALYPAEPPPGTENRPDILDDPDLIPPDNPRKLRGHGAAKSLYEKGFRHFARKDFKQAIMVYEDFLGRFPGDVYSDNAQFWIGESYFRQRRFAEAEQAYREVLRNYEHRSTLEGFKTPDAIYRIGQTYLKRNDPRRARYYFASAAERFPGTSAGRKAQRELATLILKTAGSGEDAASTRGS